MIVYRAKSGGEEWMGCIQQKRSECNEGENGSVVESPGGRSESIPSRNSHGKCLASDGTDTRVARGPNQSSGTNKVHERPWFVATLTECD